jgi:hypothetical protein
MTIPAAIFLMAVSARVRNKLLREGIGVIKDRKCMERYPQAYVSGPELSLSFEEGVLEAFADNSRQTLVSKRSHLAVTGAMCCNDAS